MKRRPTPPGEILDQEFLVPLGISQRELAKHIGCDVKVALLNLSGIYSPQLAA